MTDNEKEDPMALALPPGAIDTTVAVVPASSIPEGHQSGTPMYQQEKQGARCCGFCCDYRRAVIITCIIICMFSLGLLVFAFAAPDSIPATGVDYDDDEVVDILDVLGNIVMSRVEDSLIQIH